MDSKKEPSDEISSALDKLDEESTIIKEKKQREKMLIKKHSKTPVVKVSRQEVLKEQNLNQNKEMLDGMKFGAIMICMGILTTFLLTYHLTREEKASLVEQAVLLFCAGGWVLAAAYKR
ncbi:MAG TPA: hypothetical protein VNJ08_07175 [Bacteriovoracaceae bacterium]|nr:hypothetical protein [Bacteriovoracaceae bacterium]